MPATSQVLGRKMPRWGSLAMIAAPVALLCGATARLLLPERLAPPSSAPRRPSSPSGTKLVSESDPFSTSRAHSSGQSGRSRSRSRLNHTSQLTSVPARRPQVRMSATVHGSRSRPRTANS